MLEFKTQLSAAELNRSTYTYVQSLFAGNKTDPEAAINMAHVKAIEQIEQAARDAWKAFPHDVSRRKALIVNHFETVVKNHYPDFARSMKPLTVREYILALQEGKKLDNRPDIPEYWATPVETIERSYDRSGGNAAVVKSTISTLCKQIPALAELLANTPGSSPEDDSEKDELRDVPALPEHVRPNEALAAQASPTLDAMIEYIAHWATRSHPDYHEGAALWTLATIAARRIKLPWRDGVWPSLYIIFVAKSGRGKTEAAKYGIRIIEGCGLSFLLAPDEITPQKLISDMSGSTVPRKYSTWKDEKKESFRLQTAFAAQKGWLYDEIGDFLQEVINGGGHNSLFYRLLKRLHDNKRDYSYGTHLRGTEEIDLPSLSLIGTTVPDSLVPLSNKSKFWTDGSAGRMAFIVPPANYVNFTSAPDGEAIVPKNIIQKLQDWHERLGIPECEIIDVAEREELMTQAHGEDKKKKENKDKEPYSIECGPLPQNDIYWSDSGVKEAHQAYHEALQRIDAELNLDKRFSSNYGRFPDMALKIAMLLASLENNDRMDIRHWHRGLQIAEGWRANLHELIAQLSTETHTNETKNTYEQDLLKACKNCKKKFPNEHINARRIQRTSYRFSKEKAEDIIKGLKTLYQAGDLTFIAGTTANYELAEPLSMGVNDFVND